ncbi:hypothetical protein VNO78_19686 [Psophocarpus tetragonolobus]|uniref:Serine decarboxylase n=1 Tax=Psophocarpus tetragonolobus TaxID=3891 RepID=A0AAN9SCD0_PSOTE
MAMTSHVTDQLLPTVVSKKEEKKIEIEEKNGDMNLAIAQGKGHTQAHLASLINQYVDTLNQCSLRNLGFSDNQDFNYDALASLLHFHLNNAGDPFLGSNFSLNSMAFEVCVLNWFANIWEIEKHNYWGYVTTGGIEGNLHGILVGREQLPNGILYTSQDSHYSIFKIARMYRMKCIKVSTLVSGEIDCIDLKAILLAHKDKPAIINLNIGTTLKGGIDDVDNVIQTLHECGFSSDQFYIHCDGAVFGMMLPFVKQAPNITFKKPIGSVTISGHKFLGCPIPCGIVITRLQYINALSKDVEYIASKDVTITGSRCGHAPIFLWYAIKRKGLIGVQNEVQKCIINARYLKHRLRDVGICAMLNKFSNIVIFERPLDKDFIRRWNLACYGNIAHVVVMQHVTIEMLDSFISELLHKRPTWFKDGCYKPLCVAKDIGSENCVCSKHNYDVIQNLWSK